MAPRASQHRQRSDREGATQKSSIQVVGLLETTLQCNSNRRRSNICLSGDWRYVRDLYGSTSSRSYRSVVTFSVPIIGVHDCNLDTLTNGQPVDEQSNNIQIGLRSLFLLYLCNFLLFKLDSFDVDSDARHLFCSRRNSRLESDMRNPRFILRECELSYGQVDQN